MAKESYTLWVTGGNPYAGRAALNLGLMNLYDPEKKDEAKGFTFLRKSYKMAKANGDRELELDASWHLVRIGFNYRGKLIGNPEIRRHINNVIRLGSEEMAKEAKGILMQLRR